jgi:hypothetical protein
MRRQSAAEDLIETGNPGGRELISDRHDG